MLEKLEKLKRSIIDECNIYVYFNKPDLIERIKPLIPDIQQFVTEFIQTEDIGVEPDIKASMNADMLDIINDIVSAMEKNDSVLMYDALQSGLVAYLKLFVPEEDDEQ